MSDLSSLGKVKALAFDVFGTVVDWRGSISREAQQIGTALDIQRDWTQFADAWRDGYAPAMDQVRKGELPWMNIDSLHRLILDSIVEPFGLAGLDDAQRDHLNRAWHRLQPWADSLEGLTRLKRRFTLTTLSNGNFSLLTNMAKQAGLPWDCVISAELFGHYKPDPQTYQGTARLLDIAIDELMLVAAHPSDLRAARAQGCRTAYVIRPLEFGEGYPPYRYEADEFDLVAEDFNDLAAQLGL
ncbi:haloacid dehalogenase type II [Pseudomonas benzenivorans]|uniref:(S)-2-haloacid dehalogenase n=1 Tax=Pseudomonas benzenivorans TaxID=556533 RepID=A0ABY5H4D4_9PSED|nr:haloacid dehalogenase type II [Pseudomonas benzenivorans]UTW06953.1 haloacid dehalogenase type II [Pseudomonas benzenivorans]